MNESFQKKSNDLKKFFLSLPSLDARYGALMELGKGLPPFPEYLKVEENLVAGCQSRLYLVSKFDQGLVSFMASSDALISAGLAALLIQVYSGETPETILKVPPDFITEIGFHATLSPNRSNGLANIHLRMKKEVLKFLS